MPDLAQQQATDLARAAEAAAVLSSQRCLVRQLWVKQPWQVACWALYIRKIRLRSTKVRASGPGGRHDRGPVIGLKFEAWVCEE
ncbi:hypothetical protein [Streptomyces sp. NPDC048489]|uniref:hypothetical protein n=1 Tax=Streptomyces sp. NPDC048489 TaxID=3154504 RepID=UPI00342028F4